MEFRFASWNVNFRNLDAEHLTVFRKVHANLIALQEVSQNFHRSLSASELFAWSFYSLELMAGEPVLEKARTLGCSIFGRTPFTSVNAAIVPGLAFPERSLVVSLQVVGKQLTACAFHIPPGSNWKESKPQTMESIARWLAAQPTPLMFGIDANAPKTDHPDLSCNEWWWDAEPTLLGPSAIHKLKDAYRLFLEAHPGELAKIL